MRFQLIPFSKFALALVVVLAMAVPAMALDLASAKSQGLVGEKINGYLGAVSNSPSADVAGLVADINSKRKAKYQAIAKKNGTKLSVVENLAAKKAYGKSPSGTYLEQANGSWAKKP